MIKKMLHFKLRSPIPSIIQSYLTPTPIEKKAQKNGSKLAKYWALSVSEMFRKNQHTDGFRNPSRSSKPWK